DAGGGQIIAAPAGHRADHHDGDLARHHHDDLEHGDVLDVHDVQHASDDHHAHGHHGHIVRPAHDGGARARPGTGPVTHQPVGDDDDTAAIGPHDLDQHDAAVEHDHDHRSVRAA